MYPIHIKNPLQPLQYAVPALPLRVNDKQGPAAEKTKYDHAYDDVLSRLNRIERSGKRQDLNDIDEHQIGELVEDIFNGERTCYQWADSFHKFGFYSQKNWRPTPCPDEVLPAKPTEPPTTTTTATTTEIPTGPYARGRMCVLEELVAPTGPGKVGLRGHTDTRYSLVPCAELKARKDKEDEGSWKCLPS